MSRKSDLTFKKKQELVEIILRKDNVEKELKEKNEELTSQVQKLTDAQAESNKKLGRLNSENSQLKEKNEAMHKNISEKEDAIYVLETNSSRKTIAIICLVVIAIVGWII